MSDDPPAFRPAEPDDLPESAGARDAGAVFDPAEPEPERRWASVLTKPATPLVSGFLVAIGIILAVGLAFAFASIATILISVIIAVFLALGLDPAVRALERRRVKRTWGITIVAIAFLGVVVAIVLFVVPATIAQVVTFIENAPATVDAILASEWFTSLDATLAIDLAATVDEALASMATVSSFVAIGGGLLRAGVGIIGAISATVIVVVLTLYFLASLQPAKQSLYRLTPRYRRALTERLTEQITRSVGSAVAGALALSSVNAAVVFVLMVLVQSPIPVLLAITAWFVTLVPMIGSLVFLVIGTIAALFVSPVSAVVFAIGYFAYIQIEAYYVTPRILGKAVAVPGVLVLLSAMVGATLFGFLGALVAIPTTASVLIILREVVIPRQDAVTAPRTPTAAPVPGAADDAGG